MCAELVIREGATADAPRLAEVIRSAFERYRGALTPPTGAHNEHVMSIATKLEQSTALVAEVDGELVGVVFVSWLADHAYFDRLAVLPNFAGRGIASRLIGEVERQALARGLAFVTLRARIAQPRNVGYFERLGYSVYDRATHPNAVGEVYALLRKELALDGAV